MFRLSCISFSCSLKAVPAAQIYSYRVTSSVLFSFHIHYISSKYINSMCKSHMHLHSLYAIYQFFSSFFLFLHVTSKCFNPYDGCTRYLLQTCKEYYWRILMLFWGKPLQCMSQTQFQFLVTGFDFLLSSVSI